MERKRDWPVLYWFGLNQTELYYLPSYWTLKKHSPLPQYCHTNSTRDTERELGFIPNRASENQSRKRRVNFKGENAHGRPAKSPRLWNDPTRRWIDIPPSHRLSRLKSP